MALTEKEIIEKLKQVAETFEPQLKSPDPYGNGLSSNRVDEVDRELGDMYQNCFVNRTVNDAKLSQFLQYINKIDDEKSRYVLYCGIMRHIYYHLRIRKSSSLVIPYLYTYAATTRYSTFYDKLICINSLYDPRIMESALAMLRKRIEIMFTKSVKGLLDIGELRSIVRDADILKEIVTIPENGKVDEVTELYNKDGYKEKIEKEFNKEAILAKFNNEYPQTRGLPEWMVQGVIPGTEKDINYEEQSEQVETPKQPEPIQSTLIELQQEEQIADLKKRLNEQSKQYEKTSQEQARGLQEKEAELKKMKSKVEQFSDASDYLQQKLDEQIQKTDEAEQKANKLQEELNKIMNMGMFEFMKYKKAK